MSPQESKERKGNLLNVDKVDEGIADIALVLEINAKVEKVELAEMGLVDALQQHFLSMDANRQIQSGDKAEI